MQEGGPSLTHPRPTQYRILVPTSMHLIISVNLYRVSLNGLYLGDISAGRISLGRFWVCRWDLDANRGVDNLSSSGG